MKHKIMSSNYCHNLNQQFHGSVIKYLVVAKAVGKTREGVAGTKKKRNDKEKIETGFCSQTSGFRTHHRPAWRFLGECGFRWRMWVASVCPGWKGKVPQPSMNDYVTQVDRREDLRLR